MRPKWNDIRTKASVFAHEWKDAYYEKGEAQTFYNEFFDVFGRRRRDVGLFEQYVKKLHNESGYIDLFWPNTLIAEHKSLGGDLEAARRQALEYCAGVNVDERPRYLLTCDFQDFVLRDLSERETIRFKLADLPDHVEAFSFMFGLQERVYRDQDPANVRASELVGRLHDALEASGYRGHDLERYLVRIVFCLFADDTGIFDRDSFLFFIETRTREDGMDTGPLLNRLFQELNKPEGERSSALDEDLARFPYINGELFAKTLPMPDFDRGMRSALLEVSKFDWSNISPAIFGTLFQSVMDPEQRRIQGGHYTIEKNILKVIEPLFMDDLRAEFERLKSRRGGMRRGDLRAFQKKLGTLRFFDPACGCGNFLVVAYRELRELELEVIRAIRTDTPGESQQELDAATLSVVNVDQFYGIEISEFPVRIAEAAMWMMDHIMNNRISREFGQNFARIPLTISPSIRHADALETDWAEVLPPEQCSYVFGNPPFGGAKMQTKFQRAQVKRIAALSKRSGTLDYVAAWFIKAGEYVRASQARVGFVATNSITQGEQVAQLWPVLFERCGLEIAFAHRTFAWESNARGKAHVHVVIVGLDRREQEKAEKQLFAYADARGEPEESRHTVLSPYLFDASGLADPHLTVPEESRPINGMPRLIIGSKPIDGGHYIFNAQEREIFLEKESDAERFLHPFVGAREYLQGGERWILALHDASPTELAALSQVRKRIAAVRAYRQASKSEDTRKLADTPTLYHVNVIPKQSFLAVPETSSERRQYAPIGWLEPPTIPSNAIRLLEDASLADFALLTSAMHMAWLRYIGGRLKSDYRYSIGLVYNTFPTPEGFASGDLDLSRLEILAQAVLDARNEHPDSTLADMYDPDLMLPALHKAHQAVDKAVDRLYRREPFGCERERVEYLFGLCEQMRGPLDANMRAQPKRRSRRRSKK